MTSMSRVVTRTALSTPFVSLSLVAPSSVAVSMRCDALICLLTAKAIRDAKVMTPRPPNWTASRMTACPNRDQWVVVLTTWMPHVEAAETAVKNATTGSVTLRLWALMGSSSRTVASAISAKKYRMVSRPGCDHSFAERLRRGGRRFCAA